MASKTETRGRKPKQVDDEMFHQLASYFEDKPIGTVIPCEKVLAEYMSQFVSSGRNFDLMTEKYNKMKESNPQLSSEEIYEALYEIDEDFRYLWFNSTPLSAELFDEIRFREKNRGNGRNQRFDYYNVDDIDQANRYFQALKKEDANKLLQRLRKIKFQKSKSYGDRTVGISIDSHAHRQIKSFQDTYGFKTLSIGIMVMSRMADEYSDERVSEALDYLYSFNRLEPDEVFTSNADTKRIEGWVNEGLVSYLKSTNKFYLSAYLFDNKNTECCYLIDVDDSITLSQMLNSNRINFGESKLQSHAIGVLSKGLIEEEFTQQENNISLSKVTSLQGSLGGEDVFKAFKAVNVLLDKWQVAKSTKLDLLGFDPKKMTIKDQEEVQQRLSLLLNIHEQLRVIFDNPDNIYGYMTKLNYNEPYNGQEPIHIASRNLEGLKVVYNALSSLSGI